MMKLFDSHCHLTDEKFEGDVADVLDRMRENGVDRFLLAGSDLPTSRAGMELAGKVEGGYCAVGFHPHEASSFRPEDADTLRKWLKAPKVQALGEIGLDYFYDFSPRDVQKEVLCTQLDLALEENVPVILHVRDAHGDLLDIFRGRKGRLPSGIIHCYTGSWESAREYLDMGFYISFSGSVTFKNMVRLADTVKNVPRDRFLIETDSPYLSPEPVRGRRNEPANVRYVAQKVALLRDVPVEEVAEATYANACRVYRID